MAGLKVSVQEREVTAVLDLPSSHDEYLALLQKKERHEIRRKLRRFEDTCGPPRLIDDSTQGGLTTFAGMHRAASGEKGRFMTQEMETFFSDLLAVDGARLDLLVDGRGNTVAASFGFQDERAYYLYNSAFEPDAADASPGLVLIDRLLRRAIGEGLSRFDFLKGDEPYKFRLGARRRPLYVVETAT
jgi:CelD/BcsL family acetyltransferase involved in cellulose biosynthesis